MIEAYVKLYLTTDVLEDLSNRKMCKICIMYQPAVDFENHYICCKSDKKFIAEAEMPKPEYKLAFKAKDVLLKLHLCVSLILRRY